MLGVSSVAHMHAGLELASSQNHPCVCKTQETGGNLPPADPKKSIKMHDYVSTRILNVIVMGQSLQHRAGSCVDPCRLAITLGTRKRQPPPRAC